MSNYRVYALPLNPEPWKVGHAYVVRSSGQPKARIAPDATLQTYQNAVRDELTLQGVELLPGDYSLYFSFSRQLASYTSAEGRTSTRNASDATNMQKATEDALQGVLIGNDRDVVRVGSVIVDQGPAVSPFVIIQIKFGLTEEDSSKMDDVPPELMDEAINRMIAIEKEREQARNSQQVWEF